MISYIDRRISNSIVTQYVPYVLRLHRKNQNQNKDPKSELWDFIRIKITHFSRGQKQKEAH